MRLFSVCSLSIFSPLIHQMKNPFTLLLHLEFQLSAHDNLFTLSSVFSYNHEKSCFFIHQISSPLFVPDHLHPLLLCPPLQPSLSPPLLSGQSALCPRRSITVTEDHSWCHTEIMSDSEPERFAVYTPTCHTLKWQKTHWVRRVSSVMQIIVSCILQCPENVQYLHFL